MGMITEEEIVKIIKEAETPEAAARQLAEMIREEASEEAYYAIREYEERS
jgi:predicted Zn-ribbon and HTH transcriptional regulator